MFQGSAFFQPFASVIFFPHIPVVFGYLGITFSSLVVSNVGLKSHQASRHTRQLHPAGYSSTAWTQEHFTVSCSANKCSKQWNTLVPRRNSVAHAASWESRKLGKLIPNHWSKNSLLFITVKKLIVPFCNLLLINSSLPDEKKTLPQRDNRPGRAFTCLVLCVLFYIFLTIHLQFSRKES